jgi:hypothetical protein
MTNTVLEIRTESRQVCSKLVQVLHLDGVHAEFGGAFQV